MTAQVSGADVRLLKTITDEFSRNLLRTQGKDATRRFAGDLMLSEIFNIVRAKSVRAVYARIGTPAQQARSEVAYCAAVLPALRRNFGEGALVAALPPQGRDLRVADLCAALGAPDLAALCRKALTAQP